MKGQILEAWPIALTTVEAELAHHANTVLYVSAYRSLGQWYMQLANRWKINTRGFIPPSFTAR
ncbi:hypothetical protein KFU94_60670 [Chloroflexi bacterium TSY]|nr:hypothetical protein [Chloroflexi bacterium TSY]